MNAPIRPVGGPEKVTRTFKSGNSVAIRIPKSWGFKPGDEVEITPTPNGGFEVQLVKGPEVTLRDLYGSFSESFMANGRGDTEQMARDWDDD